MLAASLNCPAMKFKSTMPLEEQLRLSAQSIELKKAGKFEEADRIFKQVPVAPWLAAHIKKRMGAQFLLENGYNLADAELNFGKDWLNQ